MRLLVQRAKEASVTVDGRRRAGIGPGMLVLVGVGKDDGPGDAERLAVKLANLRIFEDEGGRMNLNVKQAGGAVLSVSQFTLYADTRRGNRPGFELSAPPDKARDLCARFNAALKGEGVGVEEGVFGAHMEVGLVNDGPVTILLDSGK